MKNYGHGVPVSSILVFIMRITFFLFVLGVFQVYAVDSYAQKTHLTIHENKIKLGELFNKIEKQTDFYFFYSMDQIDKNLEVSINANNKTIFEILEIVLKDTNITYLVSNKAIILNTREKIELSSRQQPSKRQIRGTVTDKYGEPIIGANIIEKGTTNGTATDIDGNFVISVGDNAVLQVSYIGYLTRDFNTSGKNIVNMSLVEDTRALEEVVVIGYETLNKKELTSAISHISSKDFVSVSSSDPMMLIQGKVPGVSITNVGAADPNWGASIQIRGASSRSAGLSPLIVIDGVPGANLHNVNPNDIESMDILKDGAASAIYGTQGSNGVIIINTKRGKKDGGLYTSFNAVTSMDFMIKDIKPLTAEQFRENRVPMVPSWDLGGSTDWIDAISKNGFSQQYTFSVSGGNIRTSYYGTIDYRDASGIDLRSNRNEYGARFSLHHQTKGGLFNFAANIAPRVIKRDNSSWDAYKIAMDANPTTPIFDPNEPDLYYDFTGQEALWNPVEELILEQSNREDKYLDWNASLTMNLLPLLWTAADKHWLTTQVMYGDSQIDNFSSWFRPSTSRSAMREGYAGVASRGYNLRQNNLVESITNYAYNGDNHNIKGMFGYSYRYSQYASLSAENRNFVSDVLGSNDLGSGDWAKEEGSVGMGSFKEDSKLIAFFGRLSYNYKSKYIITTSLRKEGSSKFGARHKWGYFPAFSVGWRVSSEEFMQSVSWINDLKLRADYGETGNQNFGNYLSLSTMRGFGSVSYLGKYYTVWGQSKNPNPDLRWEKAKNWNVGLDFSFSENRVSGSVNYYYRTQSDLLGDYLVPVPPYDYATTFVNVGTMRNTGIEIDLNVVAVKTKDFRYGIDFVGSTNNNKFLKFSSSRYVGQKYYDLADMESPNRPGFLQRIEEGQRIGNYYTWAYAGIDTNGNWLVWDKDNTKRIRIDSATEADKRVTGNGLPKFTTSLTNNFQYKNWELTLYFRGAFGFDLFNIHEIYWGLPTSQTNVLQSAIGRNAPITTGKNQLVDYFIEPGDYVKLDMAQLSYTFNMKDYKYFDGARVFVTGRNLLTFTSFSGIDPATFQTNGLTPGVNMNGGEATRRFYPSTRQLLVGVQLNF
ncbi:MAG: SusC/RagA family TonB-linked outer membrane protein [Proteiniphilum sp.]